MQMNIKMLQTLIQMQINTIDITKHVSHVKQQ